MPQFQIQIPLSLYISKSTNTSPNGEAIVMKNFIPTLSGGVQLRRGHKHLGFSDIDYIATFKSTNTLVLFSRTSGLKILNQIYMVVYEDADFKSVPVNYIETAERLLLFFNNETVKELNFNGIYNIEEVKFNDDIARVFYNATRYRNRLFFIEKDSNILWYAAILAYKGDLESFDATGVYNSKGKIVNIDTFGYTGGLGELTYLVVAFNSGDILLFDGINPSDLTGENWQAKRIISSHLDTYNQIINTGSNLFLLTANGLLDLQSAIQSNNIAMATTLLIPIQDTIKFSRARIFTHKEYIIITQSSSTEVYFFDTRLKVFFSITGFSFNHVETFHDKLIFLDTNGNLFEAFTAKNDNGNAIIGELATGWQDLGTPNNKRITFINCGMFYTNGDYKIQTGIYKNNDITKGTMKQLPLIAPNSPRWSNITPTWTEAARLWFGSSMGAYKSIKFPKMALGRNISFYFVIQSDNVDSFEFQDMSIDYDLMAF
ncbi:MAG: hypothetical protein FWE18_03770 [Alphaproteobacteria bacterium]|nr:hypothetical protein [Alphaproteobacteria bacterium]